MTPSPLPPSLPHPSIQPTNPPTTTLSSSLSSYLCPSHGKFPPFLSLSYSSTPPPLASPKKKSKMETGYYEDTKTLFQVK